jgi:hypothetical protein
MEDLLEDAGEVVLELAEDVSDLVAPSRGRKGILLLLLIALAVGGFMWKKRQEGEAEPA